MHFIISFMLIFIKLLYVSEKSYVHFFLEILSISFYTFVFAVFERIMKEDWILYDSFKRAQNIYMKLADGLFSPTYITDSMGKILYMNANGRSLFSDLSSTSVSTTTREKDVSNNKQFRKPHSFLEIVNEKYIKAVEENINIKKAGKESLCGSSIVFLEVALKASNQEKWNIPKCDLGIDSNLIEQGYMLFLLRFEKVAWKASNCIMITCENIMEKKAQYQRLLWQQMQGRKSLQILCGNNT